MKIDGRPNLNLEIVLTLNESEARALDALAGYGIDSFLEVFYAKMGKHYLQPHERGLRSLFEGVRHTSGLSLILDRTEKAKEVFAGVKEARYREREPAALSPERSETATSKESLTVRSGKEKGGEG